MIIIVRASSYQAQLDYLAFKQETEKLKAALEREVLKKIEVNWTLYCVSKCQLESI